MDLFEHRYYRLTKSIMMLIGQWPYQNSRSKRFFRAIIICFNGNEIVSQIISLLRHRNDLSILLDYAVPFLIDLICFTNFIGFMWSSEKTLQLVSRIRADWQVWAGHREINILHEYTEQGRKIIAVFTAAMYFSLFLFVTQPLTHKIIDVVLKNGTEPGKFPHPIEYYHIDMQKYYFYIMIYYCVMVVMIIMVITANNVMLVSHVVHVCGIFAALGHKLQRIGYNATATKTRETPCALEERNMLHIAWCIDRHDNAIEYANLIESIYTWNLFFTVGLGMILIIALWLQVLLNTNDPEVTIKFIAFALSQIYFFWMVCYIAQILMDHSININFYISDSEWYRLSLKAQKLIQTMSTRCIIPCQLTIGKMIILSMRTFALTGRTVMSYCTVTRSMQKL